VRAILALALLGCGGSGPNLDQTAVSNFDLGVPHGWVKKDFTTRSRQMLQWTPEDNDGKESIVIVRADRPSGAKSDLGSLLAKAQHSRFAFLKPTTFETDNGVVGSKIEGSMVVNEKTYHRIHAVFVDDTSLVNVIYTAKDLDRENFDAVINSLRKKI